MHRLPYLSPDAIGTLEKAGVSGLDLCGNGIIIVQGELLVVRSGQPKRFPRSEPIRNVYRGDSSLVGRAFMSQPVYNAVGKIVELIQIRGGTISFATVSKVLKTLEADLIVERNDDQIKLISACSCPRDHQPTFLIADSDGIDPLARARIVHVEDGRGRTGEELE